MPKTDKHYHWTTRFLELFEASVSKYEGGQHDWHNYFSDQDLAFLKEIGYKPRELFDFVEDLVDGGEPSRADAVLIAAVRRDYLREVQQGKLSRNEMKADQLPAKKADLEGFVWLPRIIQKAENKLRGENDPDIMYCCGGDRGFLSTHDIHPADFLRLAWAADGNHSKIAAYVKDSSPVGPDS